MVGEIRYRKLEGRAGRSCICLAGDEVAVAGAGSDGEERRSCTRGTIMQIIGALYNIKYQIVIINRDSN